MAVQRVWPGGANPPPARSRAARQAVMPRDRARWRSPNELVGLMALPVLLFGAVSGFTLWLMLHLGLAGSVLLISVHAYVGLVGLAIVLAKLVVGTAAWRRRARRETPGHRQAGQHVLTGLLVLTVLVLYGSGTLLNANLTPGGNAAYKAVHLYAAITGVPLVTQHLLRYLRRARTVVGRTVSAAPATAAVASRRHILGAGALGLVTWGSVRAIGSAVADVRDAGPNDFPITLTAAGSDQPDPDTWRMRVDGDVASPLVLSLADLRAAGLEQARYSLDCVTGWSATRTWGGVPLRDLLARAAPTGEVLSAVFTSTTGYQVALLREQLDRSDTLIAFQVDQVDLTPEHGFPARVMAPGVIGEKCLKWVDRVTVVCA